MNFLSLRQLGLVSLAFTTFMFVEGCGGKKKVDDEALSLQSAQAITVSQNFPSLLGNGGEFATSIAVSGNLAVVGAPTDTNPAGKFTGAAYILERQADQTWIVKQKLHPPASMSGGEINQRFGASVAIDGETVFVGAPLHPQNGEPAGLVHVFKRETQEGTYWTEETTLGLPELLSQSQWSVSGVGAAPGVQWRQMGPMTVKVGESWTVTMNGTNDADLQTRKGSPPGFTAGSFDCQPNLGSSNEACSLVGAGDHYIGVRGYDAYSKVTVQATLPTLNIAANQDAVYGPFTVKDGQRLRAQITGTGDPDLLIHPVPGSTTTPSSITALFIVGDSNLNAADIAIRDRISSLGYQVQVVDDDVATTADATGKQVVVVSESTASAKITDKYKNVAVPVVALEVAIWDDLGMTGGGWQQDFGDAPGVATLTVGSNVHPMSAQLSGDVLVATAVTSKMVWGRPGTSAQVAATIAGDATKAALFGYAAGAAMVSGTAPARRVGVFAGDPTAQTFTTSGGRLFDAAIVWATRRADALLVVAAVPLAHSDEQLRLHMTEQGLSTHVITGPNVQLTDTTGKAVVVISESTVSATVDNRLTTSTAPIISLEPGLFDELGLTGPTWLTDMGDVSGQTDVVITNPSHPLAAGLSGTVAFTTVPSKLIWGVPAANAINIARIAAQNPLSTVAAANALAIFAYEKDAAMVGRTAPARRVAWAAGDGTALALSSQGWRLFASALSWASNIPTDCAGNPQAAGCSGATSGTGGPNLAGAAACTSASPSATEMCVTPNPGAYYVTVRGFSAATYKLQVFFEPGHDNIALGGSYSMIGSDVSAKNDVVAIAGRNALGNGAGYAHVLRKKQGNWKFELSQADPSLHTEGHFAESIAVTANRLVVGAVGGRGRVLSFDYNGTSWSTVPNKVWESTDVSGNDGMGTSVAVDGDRVAFGLPGAAGGKGQLKVADWVVDRWNERDILNPQGTASASFGTSVALYQGQVAVGAPTGTNPGTAYLFANAGSNQPTVYSPLNAMAWADVGSTVAVGPLSLLVGAPHDGVSYKGVVYTIAPLQNACTGQANGTPCEDGNACSTGDTCQAGSCVSGTGTLVCNDGNGCTADSCNPQLGCVYDTKAPEQQQLACNITGCGAGTCKAGVCEGGSDSNAMCKITPQVTCVAGLSGGGFRAVFGYTNGTTPGQNLSIPVGSNNTTDFKRNLVSGGTAVNQPTWIQTGTEPVAFTVDIPAGGQAVTWALGNKTATAQPAVDGRCSQGASNDGPVIMIGGKSYLVAPSGAAITANAIRPTLGALGPLAGQGDVNPDGSYSYNVPIWVPPGTNGMQPSLSLSYNSRGGNGLVGVGWSLGGFSQITRCPKTMRVAGKLAPVTYSASDQFCLDGNPLVLLADGTYRTRIETFSKIEQTDTGINMGWKVSTKEGRIITFAPQGVVRQYKLPDHIPPIPGAPDKSTPVVPGWWITKIQDRFGNDIDFEYTNGNGPDADESAWTVERYPTKITYNRPGYAREVSLTYENRPTHDVLESYVYGIRYVTTKLLKSIEMRVKTEAGVWSTAKQYRLEYHPNATNGTDDWSNMANRKSITGRSLLKNVQECERPGDDAVCAPATTFDWEGGTWEFERKILGRSAGATGRLLSMTDVDLDGKPDLVLGEVATQDLCNEKINGKLPITENAASGFKVGCRIPRPITGSVVGEQDKPDVPSQLGDYVKQYGLEVCSGDKTIQCEFKSTYLLPHPTGSMPTTSPDSFPGPLPTGTQLCDGWVYTDYYPTQGGSNNSTTNPCLIVESPMKFARYKYLPNRTTLNSGVVSPVLGLPLHVVDRYVATGTDRASQLAAPMFLDYDGNGDNEVLLSEYERTYVELGATLSKFRQNVEIWHLGGTGPMALTAYSGQFYPGEVLGLAQSVAISDSDGDGRPEVISATDGETTVGPYWTRWGFGIPSQSLRTERVKFYNEYSNKGDAIPVAEEVAVMDLDGDGVGEFFTFYGDGEFGSMTQYAFPRALNRSPTFADMNGDGLVDALDRGRTDSSNGQALIINSGVRDIKKFAISSATSSAAYLSPKALNTDDGVRAGDFDMDGQTDILLPGAGWGGDTNNSNFSPTVLLRKGNSFRTVKLAKKGIGQSDLDITQNHEDLPEERRGVTGWRGVYALDFDGDGAVDIVQEESDGLVLYRHKGNKPDMMTTVNRGIDPDRNTVAVEYASVAENNVGIYSPVDCNSPAGVPCNNLQQERVTTGMWVAKKVTTDSGDLAGSLRHKSYKYFDGRMDKASGAFLGFRTFTTTDLETGASTETENFLGSSTDTSVAPWTVDGFGFTLAGHAKTERIRIPGPAGLNDTVTSHEYEFVTFNGGVTGLLRSKKKVQSMDDARRTGCAGYDSIAETVFSYVPSPVAGSLTGELASEVSTSVPGPTCVPSSDRVHASQTITKSFTYQTEDASIWIVGRQKDVTVTRTVAPANGTVAVLTTATAEIDPYYGVVTKVINQPSGSPDERSETEYSFDYSTGLPLTVTSRASGVPDRVVTTTYDSYGFPSTTANQLGHRSESVVDPKSGQVVWSRDMNGVITRKLLDTFYRELEVSTPSGPDRSLVVATAYEAATNSETPRKTTVETQVRSGSGTLQWVVNRKESRFDRIGREIITQARNSNGNMLGVIKVFDNLGRLKSETVPSEIIGSLGTTSYEYDELDRVTKSTGADGAVTKTDRIDLKTVITNPDNKVSNTLADNLGRTVETRVMEGTNAVGKMTYTYRADGLLASSRDSVGNVTTLEYDSLGRRLKLIDPDAGQTTTSYNGFGEVRLEVDSVNGQTTFTRDVIGRTLEQKVVEVADPPSGRPARTRITTYTWDGAPNGIGKAFTSVSYDGVVKAFGYDELGRAAAESTVRAGVEQSFTRTYDQAGRLDVLTYPEARATGVAPGAGVATRVRYTYSYSNGALTSVVNADDWGQVYWNASTRDEQGHILKERFGDNTVTTRTWNMQRGWLTGISTQVGANAPLQSATYAYSPGGLMKSRNDDSVSGGPLLETFQYDSLNRLRWWCVKDTALGSNECAQAQFGVGYTFSDNGNMTERRTFANGAKNNPLEQIAFTYPPAGSPQAHAVTQRIWAQGSGSAAVFSYDNAGRQWQRPGQTLTYNSSDLPEKIVAGSTTTTYAYDAEGTRYQKKTVISANITRTTTYASGLYELREESGTAATQPKTHVYYISAGNTMLAQLTRREPDLTAMTPEYFHNDHLGTVTFTTSAAGVASARVRTDPYGNRFDPMQPPRLDTPPPAAITGVTRGYTGHEMEVDDLGVINMKGRIFDPINGRFNSPDPMVQAPQFSQSYNRYMYVMGNPVGATDPTGYLTLEEAQRPIPQQGETYSDPNGGVHYYDSGAEAQQQEYYRMQSSKAEGWAQAASNASGGSGDRGKMAANFESAKLYVQSGGEYGMSMSGQNGSMMPTPSAVGQVNGNKSSSASTDRNGTSRTETTGGECSGTICSFTTRVILGASSAIAQPMRAPPPSIMGPLMEGLEVLGTMVSAGAAAITAAAAILLWPSQIGIGDGETTGGSDVIVSSPPDFPGHDPTVPPPGFTWRGKPGSQPGSPDGNYVKPGQGGAPPESLRPDLNHPPPIGPHWDWKDGNGDWWRIPPIGPAIRK